MQTSTTYHAIEIYLFLFALVCVAFEVPFVSSAFLFLLFPPSCGATVTTVRGLSALESERSLFMEAMEIGIGDSAR